MSSWRLRRPWPRWGAAALAGLAVVSSACQATIRIGVNANGNGGGRVSAAVVLDREATQAVPDLGQQLRTSDLLKSGWNVQGPTPTAGGGSIVTVSKAFRTPSEEAQIVSEDDDDIWPAGRRFCVRRQNQSAGNQNETIEKPAAHGQHLIIAV